jgi:hypothetical protein
MLSSSSAGWTWSTEHDDGYWDYDRSVELGEIDAVQTYYNDDGVGCNIQAETYGGETHMGPVEIEMDTGKYVIFHSRINYYFSWDEDPEERPEDCVALYVSFALELKIWNESSHTYGAVDGDYGSDYIYVEKSETVYPTEVWLHVWEDNVHNSPGTQYRLYVYTIGGWIDDESVKHPDPVGGEWTFGYYEVV